ncbi:MAG: PilT/PilU family type 4a pilus ATPase [Candidatus Sumerlaeia bacterium]|nr:PilT/PilU family type 4a pilus ATPase [Candidatus Sumerlaeia bacterium]
MVLLDDLLTEMVERQASDCFLKAGSRPAFKIDGTIHQTDHDEMQPEDVESIAHTLMDAGQIQAFEMNPEMDLAHSVRGVGRFRVNIFRQRGTFALVFRAVATSELTFEDLNLPASARSLAEAPRGMVLVTGTTGSGKSTTLAAMINHINKTRRCHIVTVEDPIEFLHNDNMAVVNQREVGFDTKDFTEALKHVLRQAPDVILIGEMRDVETIHTAINAAETGHLVFSTLHTTDAVQTVDRVINYFPAYLHAQIRMELSMSLNGVLSQRLLPLASGMGRVPAVEVMIATPTVKKLILEGKTLEIPQHIMQGGHVGMQTFNQAIASLYQSKLIKYEDAMSAAASPDELRLMISGISTGVQAKDYSRFSGGM